MLPRRMLSKNYSATSAGLSGYMPNQGCGLTRHAFVKAKLEIFW